MSSIKINNKLYARGRYTRNPVVTDAKDGSGKYVFGTIAVDQPFTDKHGDTRTSTTYIEVKVFDPEFAKVLIDGNARTGTLIEATGSVRLETGEYEKDGEKKASAKIALIVESGAEASVRIEAHAREQA
jgi:single-stranded DNA-binding protein